MTYITTKVINPQLIGKLEDNIICHDENDGYLIQAYEKSEMIGTDQALSIEAAMKSALGRELFFDIDSWTPTNSYGIARCATD